MRHLKKKAEPVLKILYVLGQVDIVHEISTFESNDNAQETKQMSSLPICKDNSWFLVRRRYEITENHRISLIYRRYTYIQKGAYRQEIKFIPIFKKTSRLSNLLTHGWFLLATTKFEFKDFPTIPIWIQISVCTSISWTDWKQTH